MIFRYVASSFLFIFFCLALNRCKRIFNRRRHRHPHDAEILDHRKPFIGDKKQNHRRAQIPASIGHGIELHRNIDDQQHTKFAKQVL